MMEQLKQMLTKELEEIASKGKMTAGELDTVDKLTHSLKSLETIMAMGEYSNEGGSYGGSYGRSYGGSYNSYEGGMSNEGSYGRGRGGNSRGGSYGGSYARNRGGRSRGYSRDNMMEELQELMEDAETEQEREAIRRCIEQMR